MHDAPRRSRPRPRTVASRGLRVALSIGALVATVAAAQTPTPAPARAPQPAPRVVNGIVTHDYPTAAALLDRSSGLQFCSAVIVGCRTALTAAHCVCSETGALCQPGGPGLVPASALELFLQHAGFVGIESIVVPPQFQFGIRDDIAVLRLAREVDGIAPAPLNTIERPGSGVEGDIVGFGLADDGIFDNGLKRAGAIATTTCTVVPGDEYVCWSFDAPLGAPGTDANTCAGDSGGPLYTDLGSGDVVAGIGSGGVNADCQPDDLPFDADVFANLAAIAAGGGADLDAAQCGNLPVAGGPGALETRRTGTLAQGATVDVSLVIPAGARAVRVALNAEEGLLINDFDLILTRDAPPPTGAVQCSSTRDGSFEFCEVASPAPGPWNARAIAVSGDGAYQLTATVLRETDLGPCTPGPHTLCIDDEPGDGRFEATVAFDTAQAGGLAGLGHAVELDSLGITSGGVFWFFEKANPEVLLKVLDGCSVNGHHWVFWSAGTNVRLQITVTDRRTARQRVYRSPDRTPALPVTDILAFSC